MTCWAWLSPLCGAEGPSAGAGGHVPGDIAHLIHLENTLTGWSLPGDPGNGVQLFPDLTSERVVRKHLCLPPQCRLPLHPGC